jgi:hypothetical protein
VLPDVPKLEQLAFGALIGVVELVDVVPLREASIDPFAEGPWCWKLEQPLPAPILWRGMPAVLNVADEAVTRGPGWRFTKSRFSS